MSELGREAAGEVLAHFGVKGMKWGVRKDGERGSVRRGATKASVALNAAGEAVKAGEKKVIFGSRATLNVAARATKTRVLGEAIVLNRDSRFKGKDLKKDASLSTTYHNELKTKATKIYSEELRKAKDQAFADAIHAIFSPDKSSMSFTSMGHVRHAAADEKTLLTLAFNKDSLGQITDVRIVTGQQETLAHGAELAESFLSTDVLPAIGRPLRDYPVNILKTLDTD